MKDLLNKLFEGEYNLRVDYETKEFFNSFTLNQLFKETYGRLLKQLLPQGAKLYQKIPQLKSNNTYHQPIILGKEHGITDEDSN